MAQNAFQIGDVVVLKSGSPKGTVSKVDANVVSFVYWNEAKNEFNNHSLDHNLLRKADSSD